MPFFRYSATDQTGKVLEGTIQARSEDEARQTLALQGYQLQRLGDPPAPSPAVPPIARSSGSPVPVPATVAAPAKVKTGPGTDKDRFFLFTQVASALRAGINPAQAFSDVSKRTRPRFTASLQELSAMAGRGGDLAEVMERYPALYPAEVAGMARAAQLGGFMPEGYEEIARQSENAHKFKRWFFWVWFVFLNAVLSIPGLIWAMQALVVAYKRIDQTGGEGGFGSALSMVGQALLDRLLWPNGPLFLLGCAVLYGAYRALGSQKALDLRHRIGLRFPVYGARARHENLARFSWTMSRLSKAGIPPARAWAAAADTVPNQAMRQVLLEIAPRLEGGEKMSDIMHGARLFPDEYGALIATGEYTGSLPDALERMAALSEGEFRAAENYAKARSGCWGLLGCLATSAAMLGIFWYFMYYVLMPTILKGFE